MKKKSIQSSIRKEYFWGLLVFLTVVLVGFFFWQNTITTDRTVSIDKIVLSSEIISNYKVVQAKTINFGENNEEFFVVAFNPILPFIQQQNTKAFIGMYKKSPVGFDLVYKYQPVLSDNSYPSPLLFEDMWQIVSSDSKQSGLVTTWGETGADYFGKFPIMLMLNNSVFKATASYEGNLGNNLQLKAIPGAPSDIEIKNFFDETNSIKSILTQGVAVEENEVVYKFYGDDACKACSRTYINLKLPVKLP